jgi:hypothetical protein
MYIANQLSGYFCFVNFIFVALTVTTRDPTIPVMKRKHKAKPIARIMHDIVFSI